MFALAVTLHTYKSDGQQKSSAFLEFQEVACKINQSGFSGFLKQSTYRGIQRRLHKTHSLPSKISSSLFPLIFLLEYISLNTFKQVEIEFGCHLTFEFTF